LTASGTQAAFDPIAHRYDDLWSTADAGFWQRQAVWDTIHPVFRRGDHVLDVGCGTGVDAVSLMASGVEVFAIDASPKMVQVARSKGVSAEHLGAEQLHQLGGSYDGAISNFGVLNCFADLEDCAQQLARLVKPGGHLALCYMGKFCAWETAHFIRSGEWTRAVRRWSSGTAATSLGIDVRYPSVRRVSQAFSPGFRLSKQKGIGILVPPSCVTRLSGTRIASLAAIDRHVAELPVLRALSDHRLLIFERV
jgi:ubiquinone/menaquinone biosynthesis C-methylase UbiE